ESEDFEYTTIFDLKEQFKVSDEELLRDISSYNDDEGFALFKRAYTNLLNTKDYKVSTTGYSYVNTMGGLKVLVDNTKKFDGTNFFMHTISKAETDSIVSSMSNKNSKHYFYVTDNPVNNIATINQVDFADETKVLSSLTCTEKNYAFNYGAIPYAVCDYILNEEIILDSYLSFDDETNLYKIEFSLDPTPATVNLVKKMYMISGTNADYSDGTVDYTVYVDSNFMIKRMLEVETYNVDAPVVGRVSAEGLNDDRFYYIGDEDYEPISENEKYDLTNVPTDEEKEDVNTEAVENSKIAFSKLAENGINSNFNITVGDINFNGRIKLSANYTIQIQIDTFF
ncbi:MAG: hypothetical protein KBS91_04225, partial [Firmicutes bacterium]|nr:hypothetical protein [Candidatus Caballimonas caccae]